MVHVVPRAGGCCRWNACMMISWRVWCVRSTTCATRRRACTWQGWKGYLVRELSIRMCVLVCAPVGMRVHVNCALTGSFDAAAVMAIRSAEVKAQHLVPRCSADCTRIGVRPPSLCNCRLLEPASDCSVHDSTTTVPSTTRASPPIASDATGVCQTAGGAASRHAC